MYTKSHAKPFWDTQREWIVLLRYKKVGEEKQIDKSDRQINQ